MSEQLKINPENKHEYRANKAEAKEKKTDLAEHLKAKHEHQAKIREIRNKIEESSKTSQELSQANTEEKPKKTEYNDVVAGSQLETQSLKQNLNKIQRKLPSYQRPFSKFVHNKTVEKVSDAAGATIARPSGILFAGIFSFIMSLLVLSVSRYFGYEYNFMIGLASLGGGFIIGLMLEAIMKLFKKLKTN